MINGKLIFNDYFNISNAKSVNFYFPSDVEKFYVVLKLYVSETINQFTHSELIENSY